MHSIAAWILVFTAWTSCTLFSTPAYAGMIATPRSESSEPAREALGKAVLEKATELGIRDRIPEKAIATASVAQLSLLASAMSTSARAGQVEFVIAAVCVVLLVVFLLIILSPSGSSEPAPPPAPPRDPVPAIRNCAIKIVTNVYFSYTPKDEGGARQTTMRIVHDRLNELGAPDGNTFTEAQGEAPNFHVNITIHNDGTDHFSATLSLSGWGWGDICTVGSGEYKFSSEGAPEMIYKVVDSAYGWIHNGWHENR